MSATTRTPEQDLALGTQVTAIAIDTLRVIAAAAIAWSFTTWWSIALAFVLSYLAALAACWAAAAVAGLCFDTESTLTPALTAVGSAVFSAADTVRGWFTSTPSATA